MPTGRAIEPVPAVAALCFRQTLFLFAFRAFTVHLPVFNIIFKKQGTFRALGQVALANLIAAVLRRTDKDRLAALAKIFTLGFFFTDRTFFHETTSSMA
jgi:hypothetical protein